MTGVKLERCASLSLSQEMLTAGQPVSNVGHRRRNGLGNIFQGMSQNDISQLRVRNGRSLSCPCRGDVTTSQSNSKTRYHLLHQKRWIQRRMAMGNIFADIAQEKVHELLSTNENMSCFQKLIEYLETSEDKENMKMSRQRRFALSDIFVGIPEAEIQELICRCLDNNDPKPPSSNNEEMFGTEIDSRFKRACCRRRFGLGDIFIDIPDAERARLTGQKAHVTVTAENSTENKEQESSSSLPFEGENECFDKEDSENNLYLKTFFRSIINQHQKQRVRHMNRTMSLPCYSQFDMAQHLYTDKRRNGQWDVLNDVTCQDYCSLKGRYASSVVFASC